MSYRTFKVGLTGGIGSGKTTVSDMFSRLGVPVIDADVIARDLLSPGSETSKIVVEEFGEDITDGKSAIDRGRLRKLVFEKTDARKRLEAILHPLVHRKIRQLIESIHAPYCVIVIPLLFEAKHQDLVDRILVIDTKEENQILRASARDRNSVEDIKNIIASQIPAHERTALADDVIHNDGSIEQLASRVSDLDRLYRSFAVG